MSLLVEYLLRLLPGFLLGGAILAVTPRSMRALRLAVYIFLFLLIRDVMTPVGLWTMGEGERYEIKFLRDPLVVALMGASTAGIVFGLVRFEPELSEVITWHRGRWFSVLGNGLGGAVLVRSIAALIAAIVAPAAGLQLGFELEPAHMLPSIWLIALVGNLYEELLFRGWLQGLLLRHVPPNHAALLSGLLFGFCHLLLCYAVTDRGLPVLALTVLEGVVCGFVYNRGGLLASTLTHGCTVGALASGAYVG